MDAERACVSPDHDDACVRVRAMLTGGSRILVKGSRSMHMERIVEALAAEERC